jgi:UrcA family protein
MNVNYPRAKRTFLSVLAGLSLVLGAATTPGATVSRDGAPEIRVKYSSVEIATPQGAAALYKRIRGAAAKVCAAYESDSLIGQVVWQRCIARTVANAVVAVHQPMLTALHEQQTGFNRRG